MELRVVADHCVQMRAEPGSGVDVQIARAPKPYIHPITLDGEPVSLASPHDHVHHRGLMFAMRVDGINFWEEEPRSEAGAQHVVEITKLVCDNDCCQAEFAIEWMGPGEHYILTESRSIRLTRAPAGGFFITQRSRLTPREKTVELSGTTPFAKVSYFGFGMRFARCLDQGGQHLHDDGRSDPTQTLGATGKWHDYSGRLDASHRDVGVALLDHPRNPRHPTEWFTMAQPFAFVSASLIATKPWSLVEPVQLVYGGWVHPGKGEREAITASYQDWVEQSSELL